MKVDLFARDVTPVADIFSQTAAGSTNILTHGQREGIQDILLHLLELFS